MIEKIVKAGLTSYYDGFADWKDAIRASFSKMLEKGIIEEGYVDEVLNSIVEFGPYVIIAPHVAIPHSALESNSVNESAFSFTRFKNPVVFDENDRSKDAKIFFSFAAKHEEDHLKSLVQLVEFLINDEVVTELFDVNNDEELLAVVKKYSTK